MNQQKDFEKHLPQKIRDIHHRAQQASAKYKTAEIELINILDEVEQNRVFLRYGCNSLFQYGVQCLGLSDSVVYTLIAVTRKSREVPELKNEIKEGRLTVSKAKRIASVITKENKNHWIEMAKTSTQSKVEREVSKVNPQEARKGRMTYIHPQNEIQEKVIVQQQPTAVRVQLQVGISEKLMIKIRRVQDLVSDKSQKPASLEQALESIVELFLEKHDPVKKAERQFLRGKLSGKTGSPANRGRDSQSSTENSVTQVSPVQSLRRVPEMPASSEGTTEKALNTSPSGDRIAATDNKSPGRETRDEKIIITNNIEKEGDKVPRELLHGSNDNRPGRRKIPAATKHRVMIKFAGQCGHVSHKGDRCRETRFLEIHHLKPVSQGGSNHLENLTLLCSGHHQAQHLNGV